MAVPLSRLASSLPQAERRGDCDIVDVTHDSRQVRPGWLFCALRGTHVDGHAYAQEALRRGASALLVDHWLDVEVPQVRVPLVRPVMGIIAAAVHAVPSERLRIVGVTGTNGKTTTAYLLERAFAAHGWQTGLIGTIETRVGGVREPSIFTTPEATDLQRALERMVRTGVDVVAMEVSSHGLDQWRLTGTRFELGIFTNLAPEHLDYHGTMEHYYASKALLFDPGYCARGIVCIDDPWGARLADQVRIPTVTFGRSADAQVRVEVVSSGLDGTHARLRGRVAADLTTPLVGSYNAVNMAAAYLAAIELGVAPDEAREGIASCELIPGRFELVDQGQPFLVVVDYAHTPGALAGLIATGRDLAGPGGRVHVVVGSRGGRDRLKRPQTGGVAASADTAILTSDQPGHEDPMGIIRQMLIGTIDVPFAHIVVEPDRRAAIVTAVTMAKAGDVILIAGRGHERMQQVGDRAVPFDDRDVAREALGAAGFEPSARSLHAAVPIDHAGQSR